MPLLMTVESYTCVARLPFFFFVPFLRLVLSLIAQAGIALNALNGFKLTGTNPLQLAFARKA